MMWGWVSVRKSLRLTRGQKGMGGLEMGNGLEFDWNVYLYCQERGDKLEITEPAIR